VFGATFFTTLAGFSWAVTQWAPFALVTNTIAVSSELLLTPYQQLADAILSDPNDEDASSILLDDTRSRRIGNEVQDPERQLLVGNEDEDENLEDEVRSFRSSASMDEDQDQQRNRIGSLMQNDSARMSHLDVHGSGASGSRLGGGVDGGKTNEGSLAAKAGIILVR
jgi:solute carrier family 45, member 1/2/4